ncbi:adenosylcobalamin-dependent ribonucleoside-diphosphate reductase [Gymnodinialimonas sp. 2305UL16-5]|uniref:adenosylcobalamin-dependent ribonucleoside-diphosphate reductase n=1 Tax=Gymnodinialimonas mytili TaxID=3126503 RepID=UPI00309B8494
MPQRVEFRLAESSFDQPIAQSIWAQKYQYRKNRRDVDRDVTDTWRRVAHGLALAEPEDKRAQTARVFQSAMEGFKLLPAGRILAGCGTDRNVTLSNTFVMQTIDDSVEGIMETAKQAALTMQMGGGLGYDFSTIRPKGAYVSGLDCPAAGPIAAMEIFDSVCAMIVQGMGRGAMMATMRCDHPSIEDFVNAKSDPSKLRNFNLSVMVTDAFMEAVESDAMWNLTWDGQVVRRIAARDLWQMIMTRTYEAAEPGVLFIDRINAMNPLNYLEDISATNSCAEQPLPPNGTCPLASINLARLVRNPFTAEAQLDVEELRRLAGVAVHMLDNSIEVSRFANELQRQEALSKRRIGVGLTAVADALVMVGVTYGTEAAADMVGEWMRIVQNAAYRKSAELAETRGAFPAYDPAAHQDHPMIARLDPDVRRLIMRYGLRNGALTSIAPTGTISMFAGNVSSGIEPVFSRSYTRYITNADGSKRTERVEDYALWLFRRQFGPSADLPDAFVTAMDLDPMDHVKMQAAVQHWVDSGISKTVNCPEQIPFDAFKDVYRYAFESGCKGCTTFRPNATTGSILAVS